MLNGRYDNVHGVSWYKDDVLHREDGPAYEGVDGNKHWYLNGLTHRDDGPAVEWADGSKFWWVDGKRHRIDGPAIENPDGSTEWWIDGKRIDIMVVFGYLPSVPLSTEEQMILRLSV